jgi:ATP-dependent DNA ligase
VPFETASDLVHVSLMFRHIRAAGGEGLILRRPGVSYSITRTNDVLKVKRCPITGELAWEERRTQAA